MLCTPQCVELLFILYSKNTSHGCWPGACHYQTYLKLITGFIKFSEFENGVRFIVCGTYFAPIIVASCAGGGVYVRAGGRMS